MKRIITMFLLVSLLMPNRAEAGSIMFAKGTVDMRLTPDPHSKLLGRLYWNDEVKVIQKEDDAVSMVHFKSGKYTVGFVEHRHLRKHRTNCRTYRSPVSGYFKSYMDAKKITDRSSRQFTMKSQYHLDKTGVWMIGDRYCAAIGQYYSKHAGIKFDVILKNKDGKLHTLKCISGDEKDRRNTIMGDRVHSDGSMLEFIVNTSFLPRKARQMGNISFAGKQFQGSVYKIRVYGG